MEFLAKDKIRRPLQLRLAITMFIALDMVVLTANFWLSQQIAEDAVAINLAGRQRMLSQRMVKTLFQQQILPDGALHGDHLNELRTTFELFDSTLHAFAQGGTVLGGDGAVLQLAPISNTDSQFLIQRALRTWQPYRATVFNVLKHANSLHQAQLDTALRFAITHNMELLDLMNSLTTQLENNAVRKTQSIRLFQTIAFGLAMLNFVGIVVMMRRELRHASRHLGQLNSIIHNIDAGILVCDKQGRVKAANMSAAQLFGYKPAEMNGMPYENLLFLQDGILFGRHQDGSRFYAQSREQEFMLDGSHVRLKTISDVTLQHTIKENLSQLAYHDPLTGLPNRLLFEDRLQQSLLAAKRRRRRLAVMFIDLDKFKQVNDTYGHHVGDQLLKAVAKRLEKGLRGEDTVSRLGGDEFAVLLASINGPEDCETVAQNLLAELQAPLEIEGVTFTPSASIGISLYPDHAREEGRLLELADQTMYQVKHGTGPRYALCCAG